MKNKILLLSLFSMFSILVNSQNSDKYLDSLISVLDTIESATYFTTMEGWDHGDSIPKSVQTYYVKSYENPSDSIIGVNWVTMNGADTSIMEFGYDGNRRIMIYDDSKRIFLDSFNVRNLPFRPMNVPFYSKVKSIMKYARETEDSVTLERVDYDDTIYFKLTICEETQVEFFGKAVHMPEPSFYMGDPTSRYEVWVNKTTGLPYKMRREMSHSISVLSVNNYTFNRLRSFDPIAYAPMGYEIRSYREMNKRRSAMTPSALSGTRAPDWQLNSSEDLRVSLNDLTSKVILLQFTSVSCGPCRMAIPFMNELKTTYGDDLEVIAIECTSGNSTVLDKYKKRNDMRFPFLLATKEDPVISNYQVKAFPMFYLLDEDRTIRKVFMGYGLGTTDKEIIAAINLQL